MRRHDPGSTRVTVFNQREVEPSRSVVSATMLGMGNPIWTDQLAAWSALVSAALTLGLLVLLSSLGGRHIAHWKNRARPASQRRSQRRRPRPLTSSSGVTALGKRDRTYSQRSSRGWPA